MMMMMGLDQNVSYDCVWFGQTTFLGFEGDQSRPRSSRIRFFFGRVRYVTAGVIAEPTSVFCVSVIVCGCDHFFVMFQEE